jgi:hypothetical protein
VGHIYITFRHSLNMQVLMYKSRWRAAVKVYRACQCHRKRASDLCFVDVGVLGGGRPRLTYSPEDSRDLDTKSEVRQHG